MNEFVFPDPPRLSVDLVPSVNRGGAVPAVSDLLQLGTPQVNRLTDLPSWIDDKEIGRASCRERVLVAV